jgi:hypothetical protein
MDPPSVLFSKGIQSAGKKLSDVLTVIVPGCSAYGMIEREVNVDYVLHRADKTSAKNRKKN